MRGERHHCDTPGICYCQRKTLVAMADLSNTEIGARFDVHEGTVYQWRRYYELSAPPQRFARKYGTDQGFFARIDTPEKAYILGFIVADGCIHKSLRTVMIGLRETDAEILNQIAQAMRCDAPLRYLTRNNGTYPTRYGLVRLELHGTKLVQHLSALGVSPNKTRTATFPPVPAYLERHLVRGLWDGDGWIGKRAFSLIGPDALLEGTADAVERHTGLRLRFSPDRQFKRIQGARADRLALQWMYSGATLALPRKMEKYQTYWA